MNDDKSDIIRMSGIEEYSISNGVGIHQVLFSSICLHDCYGCHNPESHDYNNGFDITINDLFERVEKNRNKGVTFSGGDPMYQAEQFLKLAKLIKERTDKDIWCYTGFTYEEILKGDSLYRTELMDICDVLVDGRYVDSKKDITLALKGSSNQRIIDMQSTIEQGKIVLHPIEQKNIRE